MTIFEDDREFEVALEACCRRVAAGEPLERCLAAYDPRYQEELARLVLVSQRLGGLALDPLPAFETRLEERLLAAVDEEGRRQKRGIFARVSQLFSVASLARTGIVALLVLVFLGAGGFGVVQAADATLPDSPLYQVKRAREWVQVALARDSQAQVNVRVEQIAARGGEVEAAVRTAKGQKVLEVVAARLGKATEHMVDQAVEARARGNPQPAVRALIAIRTMQRRLERLETQASPEVRPVLERMGAFLTGQERRLLQGTTNARAL